MTADETLRLWCMDCRRGDFRPGDGVYGDDRNWRCWTCHRERFGHAEPLPVADMARCADCGARIGEADMILGDDLRMRCAQCHKKYMDDAG